MIPHTIQIFGSAAVAQRESHCLARSGLGFDPRQGMFVNKTIFLPETSRDGGAETQSLVSVPNITGLNFKFLRNAHNIKAYVLLIAICPPDGDVGPDGPLSAFR